MFRFKTFNCPVCTRYLCSVHYKNMGMVSVWCEKCNKTWYINKLEIVKEPK